MFNGYADQVAGLYTGMDLEPILLKLDHACTLRCPSAPRPFNLGPILRAEMDWGATCRRHASGLILNLLRAPRLADQRTPSVMAGSAPIRSKRRFIRPDWSRLPIWWLSLAVTPLADGRPAGRWVIQFRSALLGVFAFYYACAHLAIYFWWDRERSLNSTVYEITHRYYLMIGFLSLVLMFPLWATSFNAAIKFLGGKRWKQLHRLAYLAAGLACWHFYLQTKADKRRPEIYIAVLAALLLWRVVLNFYQRSQHRENSKKFPKK